MLIDINADAQNAIAQHTVFKSQIRRESELKKI